MPWIIHVWCTMSEYTGNENDDEYFGACDLVDTLDDAIDYLMANDCIGMAWSLTWIDSIDDIITMTMVSLH